MYGKSSFNIANMLQILFLFLNLSLIKAQEEQYAVCEMKLIQITYDKFVPMKVTVNWCGRNCNKNCSLILLTERTQRCFKYHMGEDTLLDLTPTIKIQHQICGCNYSSLKKCIDVRQSFNFDNCACKCTNQTMEDGCLGDNRIWDNNSCECVAKRKECTTTTFWNKLTNRCELNP